MTSEATSYRRILKTSSITGGSSVISLLIGLIRTKALAVLLGPSGVGLVGLYTGLMSTATTLSNVGIGTVGTRQIAASVAKEDALALAIVRRSMIWGALLLATMGAVSVWQLREVLAVYVLGSIEHTEAVGWLALGVAFSVASASQGALIQGMRRIKDMARLSVYGALLNAIIGISLIFYWGDSVLWAYVIVGPLVNFLLGHIFVARLPKVQNLALSAQQLSNQWRLFLRIGIPFMGAGLASTGVQFWIRISVSNELGLDAVGHFQAAWSISMQYIGFVLAAMGADYYPRLTGVIHDKLAASRLVNEQSEIALLLSAPLFIAMMGLVSWLIALLYSNDFLPAVEVLRWQILGDVLKVACWPLGFIILAAGAGKTFFMTQATALLLMGSIIAWGLPHFGLQITGIAFIACYAYLLPLNYFLAWRRIGFRWSATVVKLLLMTLLLCITVLQVSLHTQWGVPVTLFISGSFAFFTLVRLVKMTDVGGPVAKLISKIQSIKKRA